MARLENVDKGRLRRLVVSVGPEGTNIAGNAAPDVRAFRIYIADGYGTPVKDSMSALLAGTNYLSVQSPGEGAVWVEFIGTANIASLNLGAMVVTGTLVTSSVYSGSASGGSVTAKAMILIDSTTGTVELNVENTNANDQPYIRISCGGDVWMRPVAWS
jgi:hypothetical protein